jgi:uncharacterized integral membrane protein
MKFGTEARYKKLLSKHQFRENRRSIKVFSVRITVSSFTNEIYYQTIIIVIIIIIIIISTIKNNTQTVFHDFFIIKINHHISEHVSALITAIRRCHN